MVVSVEVVKVVIAQVTQVYQELTVSVEEAVVVVTLLLQVVMVVTV
jgi:hypothetical protein